MVHVNFWDMSNWSRAMLVPLAIINHFKPTRPAKVDLDELYPEGIHERDLALRPTRKKFHLAQFFPLAGPAAQVRRMVRRA
jgi:squalene-hopene/tetraprenyl-beta-curcumene cyclase